MDTRDDATSIAASTITLLESRLRALELLVIGTAPHDPATPTTAPSSPKQTITSRLQTLEHDLKTLTSRAPVVHELLSFYDTHNDLFTPTSSTTPPNSTLTPLILAHAPTYTHTTSSLTSLADHPIPPASTSTSLILLQPRLQRAQQVQMELEVEVAELRERSARVVERWVDVSVIGGGEVWGSWEERLRGVERDVRRTEKIAEKEKGEV